MDNFNWRLTEKFFFPNHCLWFETFTAFSPLNQTYVTSVKILIDISVKQPIRVCVPPHIVLKSAEFSQWQATKNDDRSVWLVCMKLPVSASDFDFHSTYFSQLLCISLNDKEVVFSHILLTIFCFILYLFFKKKQNKK